MSTYTITGGAGFIGSHLADALLGAGHTVRVLDDLSSGSLDNLDARCVFFEGDVRDRDVVMAAMEGADGCFHLAAIASVERGNQDWLGTHAVNQTGSIVVLDCARALGARALGGIPVVYASSAAVYGDCGEVSVREDQGAAPMSAYGADKRGSELHARVAFEVHGVPSLGLRFFNVYGPRQDPLSPYSGVISIFARLAADGCVMTVHGDGSQTRDFVYVGDVVAHLQQAMRVLHQTKMAQILNVCTGRGTSVLDLAQALVNVGAKAGGGRARIVHGEERFVLSSTANLFGGPRVGPIGEGDVIQPGSPYGESKLMIERALHWAHACHGLKSASLRYFNAAGAAPEGHLGEDHDPETHLIPLVIDAALGRRKGITIFGTDYATPDGTCIRDYVHVTDIAEAHLCVLGALRDGSVAYNIGNGGGYSVLEVIAAVEAVSGVKVPVEYGARRAGDPAVLVAASDRIRAETGWSPRFADLRSIVETAFAWRKANPNGFNDR